LIPQSNKTWLNASITEWIPSDNIEELPVNAAAINFEADTSISTPSEMYINVLDFIGAFPVIICAGMFPLMFSIKIFYSTII
jgi:hypothetical protein